MLAATHVSGQRQQARRNQQRRIHNQVTDRLGPVAVVVGREPVELGDVVFVEGGQLSIRQAIFLLYQQPRYAQSSQAGRNGGIYGKAGVVRRWYYLDLCLGQLCGKQTSCQNQREELLCRKGMGKVALQRKMYSRG